MALSAALFIGLWTDGHDWGGDFAGYLMQAEAIVYGRIPQYMAESTFTITASSYPIGPIAYPWGFPALLAPIYATFGLQLQVFKFVGLGFFLSFLATLWLGWSQLLGARHRLLLVGCIAFNPNLLRFGDNILSDFPFLFFSTVSIGLMLRPSPAKTPWRDAWWHGALGTAMALAVCIRTTGLLLVLTYLTLLAARIRTWLLAPRAPCPRPCMRSLSDRSNLRQAGLAVLPFLLVGAIWTGFGAMFPYSTDSYLVQLHALSFRGLADHLRYYAILLGDFFSPGNRGRAIGLCLYLLSLSLVWRGLRSHWRKTVPLVVYAALTVALHLAWPSRQGLRFWFPLLPCYVTWLILGINDVAREKPRRGLLLSRFWTGAAGTFLAASIFLVGRNLERNRVAGNGPATPAATQMFDYLRRHTTVDAVVVFRKPRVMRLFTERRSVLYTTARDFARFDAYVVDKTASDDQLGPDELRLLLARHPAEIVFENEQFVIYRFESGGNT